MPLMTEYRIAKDDLSSPEIAELLRFHFEEMHRWSTPDSCHVFPIDRLRAPDVTCYSAWHGSALAACGALKHLATGHGEIKSMRANPEWRGMGAGKAILQHILGEAKRRGYTRVSLETGRPEPFLPARQLYESHGFRECPPFADYEKDPFSMCMSLEL